MTTESAVGSVKASDSPTGRILGALDAPATKVKAMSLSGVRRGVEKRPDRFFGYGVEKVGKTTFASEWPSPIFICSEDGTHRLDVARFPEPKSFEDVMEALEELRVAKHTYKTVVVDTIDWVEQRFIYPKVKREAGWSDAQAEEYSRWYKIAISFHRKIMDALDRLRAERGMHCVVLAHAKIQTFSNPVGPDYQRYIPAVGGNVGFEVWKQWADTVAFLAFADAVVRVKGKEKGTWTGGRLIRLRRQAAFDAGSRYPVPDQIPMSYEDYETAREGEINVDALVAEAEQLLNESVMPEEQKGKSATYLRGLVKSPTKLRAAVNRLKVRVEKEREERPEPQPQEKMTDGGAGASS